MKKYLYSFFVSGLLFHGMYTFAQAPQMSPEEIKEMVLQKQAEINQFRELTQHQISESVLDSYKVIKNTSFLGIILYLLASKISPFSSMVSGIYITTAVIDIGLVIRNLKNIALMLQQKRFLNAQYKEISDYLSYIEQQEQHMLQDRKNQKLSSDQLLHNLLQPTASLPTTPASSETQSE